MRELVLDPLGMTASTFEQPLHPIALARGGDRPSSRAALPVPGGWHVYPEMAEPVFGQRPPTLPRVIIEVQRAWAGLDTAILSQRTAREMLSPQSGGPVGIGFWVEEGHSVRFLSRGR